MFGLQLTRVEWLGLAAMVYLAGRVLFAFGRVVVWFVADARRVVKPHGALTMLSAVAVAALMVALLASLTDWPVGGLRAFAYGAAGVVGFFLGFMFDIVIDIRSHHLSNWLTGFRVPQYRERLLHGDAAVRLGAAERLAGVPQYAGPARPELLAVFRRDESADVRALAGQTLLYSLFEPLPEDDGGIVTEARGALGDPDLRVRTAATALLFTFKAAPVAEVLPLFIAGLTSEQDDTITIAAQGLEKIGPEAEPAVPALQAAALHPERPSAFAIVALQRIGLAAVPALIEVLERGERFSKWSAAEALGDIGAAAAVAVPALRKAAANPDTALSTTAKRSLAKLGEPVRQ